MSQPTKDIVCGFVGLGSQGGPIARRMIDQGLNTILWARRAASLEPYKDSAARYADTVEELAQQVDHLGVCVVNDNDVREVCDKLIPNMKASSVLAIHATILPDTVRAVAEQASKNGIRVIDAPVSGGQPAAEAGTLTVMVGADEADLERARPVFETFSNLIIHLGKVGAGQQAKLINNTLFTAHLGMAHDALRAAEKLGINQDSFVQLVQESSGQSFGFGIRAKMPPPEKFRHPAELLEKDVRLLGDLMGINDPAYKPLRQAADEFLGYVLNADPKD